MTTTHRVNKVIPARSSNHVEATRRKAIHGVQDLFSCFGLLSANPSRLLSGNLVGIQVGEQLIEVHQNLLNSVTDVFKDILVDGDDGVKNAKEPVDLLARDVETFQRFLAWLYSSNRRQHMRKHNPKALIPLYCLSISLKSEPLKADVLYHLRRIIGLVSSANSFNFP